MKLCFITSGLLIMAIAFRVPAPAKQIPPPAFELAIAILAVASVIAGFAVPRLIDKIASSASPGTTNGTPLSRWTAKNVFSLAFFEACLLFGFVLNRLGGRVRLVEGLFALSMIALLIWSPGTPPEPDQTGGSRPAPIA